MLQFSNSDEANYLTPPKEVARVIRSEKYPQYMNVDERESWENTIKSLSDEEFGQIRPNLNALALKKEWRKGMKKQDWDNHWYKLTYNLDLPRTDINGNRRK